MKKSFSLVHIGRDTFIMLNANENLKNNQCNSTIFINPDASKLDTNVFHYFGLKVTIIKDNLDRRTKKFKDFEKQYPYFSASFLPTIKKRALNNSLINFDYRKL